MPFCLYMAARVFIEYLKWRPKDEQIKSSLQFLLAAMNALQKWNPLTLSFLAQLKVDVDDIRIATGSDIEESMAESLVRSSVRAFLCATDECIFSEDSKIGA